VAAMNLRERTRSEGAGEETVSVDDQDEGGILKWAAERGPHDPPSFPERR